MIISNLIGGLGNQMFQFACGYALARRLEQDLLMCVDQFERYKVHDFQLDKIFDTKTALASHNQLIELLGWRGHPITRQILAKVNYNKFMPNNWFQESNLRYCEEINSIVSDSYLHGYWQSPKYFTDYANEIREIFKFKNKISEENSKILSLMDQSISISAHIRRGDYFHKSNKILNCLEKDYYLKGLKILTDEFPESRVFFFSDDPEWVSENLADHVSESYIIDHNKGKNSYWDMMLMSNADHNVIANSSFSWWAAWLNVNERKIVISPKDWFLGSDDKCADLVPEEWIRI